MDMVPHGGLDQIEQIRNKLIIRDPEIRVVFEKFQLMDDKPSELACYECEPCECLLLYNQKKQWWFCPECGVELTNKEAVLLINKYEDHLTHLRRTINKQEGKSWLLGRFFSWLRGLVR